MPRPEKVQAVEEIRRRLAEARATFVTEYRGLTVAEQQTLRAELRKADGDYKVLKMSLARLAADAEGLESLRDVLAGPTALAFATTDAVTVAKALRDFAREHERLIIKAGVLSGEVLAPEKVEQLADIEPRDVLLGRIAGGFQAPLAKLAGLLQAFPRNAASMFSQLLEKKEDTPEPSAEEPAAKPTVAEPEAEEPAEEPTVAEPEAEEPEAEEPTVAEPKAEERKVEEPEAEEPAAKPEAEEPKPKVAKPKADKPKPEAEEPKPKVAKPRADKPKPEATKPAKKSSKATVKSEPAEAPEADEPETAKPKTTKPKTKATETEEE